MYLRKWIIIQKSTGSSVYMILLGASGFPLRKAPLYSEIVIFFKEWCIPLKRETSAHDFLDKNALFFWENAALLERMMILQCGKKNNVKSYPCNNIYRLDRNTQFHFMSGSLAGTLLRNHWEFNSRDEPHLSKCQKTKKTKKMGNMWGADTLPFFLFVFLLFSGMWIGEVHLQN